MKIIDTDFPDLKILQLSPLSDFRGSFMKIIHTPTFEGAGLGFSAREIYTSRSKRGVIRGLHFQIPPYDHDKLVFCLQGSLFDVSVDLRRSSPTYGRYFSVELTDAAGMGVLIPKGFAHGLQALVDDTIIVNATSVEFAPQHERGLAWDSCGIAWPLADPIVSDKDRAQTTWADFASVFV